MTDGPRVPEERSEERAQRLEEPFETPRSSAPQGPTPEVPWRPTPEVPWRRLDPRMLLVHPVTELIKFFPVLIGVVVLGSSGRGELWQLLGVAVPVALGLLRYVTTRFRITETQVELRRGLLSQSTLTARIDRVRAVELTSTVMHRLLGLAKVEIGTASAAKDDDESFALDALRLAEARELRVALLHRAEPETSSGGVGAATASHDVPGSTEDEVLVRFDWRWVRFAPLTTSGTVIAVALVAATGQFVNGIAVSLSEDSWIVQRVEQHPVATIAAAVVAFLLVGAVFSVLGYLVTNGGFVLSRDARGRSYHVRRGLLTSRETSLEVERVRGVEVAEPLGLRIAGAARLGAIVTGVSKKESGTTQLVPPAPRGTVDGVAALAIGDSEPLHLPLTSHGPRARIRRYTRALGVTAVLPAVALVLVITVDAPVWLLLLALVPLPLAALVAADRYRRLGHALTDRYLVVRSGTFVGRRDAVQRTGIIGWNIRQSFFQRRAGVATLVATTAAGKQAYAAIDVPLPLAVAVADEAVPGLLTPFRAH